MITAIRIRERYRKKELRRRPYVGFFMDHSHSDDDAPGAGAAIPIIDLSRPDRHQLAQDVRHACEHVGFFYLEGHGMEPEFLKQVFEQSKQLFRLDVNEKTALSDKIMSRGYTAFREETLDPERQTSGDTKEGYYIGVEVSETDPRYDPAKLRGPNQWPSQELLPKFQSTMTEYHARASKLGIQVAQIMALALELDDEHYFDQYFTDVPLATLRLLHYAKEESRPEDGIFACGAHSDYGFITLLLTDEHPGLQIYHKEVWMDVPSRPNAFVVNIGDMLERWTNGLFVSTKHRVLTSGDYERYSIPFFFEPTFETIVQCLESCCSESNPPKYPSITSGQHLLNKYAETHADFEPADTNEKSKNSQS